MILLCILFFYYVMQQLPEIQQLVWFIAFCLFALLPIGIAVYEYWYNKNRTK